MAVKIRLARHGAKKRPYYRVVVADSRAPRDGRIIEEVGRYNPMTAPKTINLDLEKIADWQSKGAQLTDAVAALVKAANEGGCLSLAFDTLARASPTTGGRAAALSVIGSTSASSVGATRAATGRGGMSGAVSSSSAAAVICADDSTVTSCDRGGRVCVPTPPPGC